MKLNDREYIPQISVDCVIFGYSGGALKVLIAKIKTMESTWTLPGGFVKQTESLEDAARRITLERTGIDRLYLDQFGAFGSLKRVNIPFLEKMSAEWLSLGKEAILEAEFMAWFSKRFISIGFYALLDIHQVHLKTGVFDESIEWYPVDQLPCLIMDHAEMVEDALATLRDQLDRKLIAFQLLPETFTMRSLQEVYESVYDRPFSRNNFQKKMLDSGVLERLDKVYSGAAHKAPFLYRFKQDITT